jgi:FkbH-like protein
VERSEDFLRTALQDISTVRVVSSTELDRLYPVPDYYDRHADELGHVPYTPDLFAALGTMIARHLHAARMRPYKVIVLDCDDTLWEGVCGEDGPQGVRLDAGRRALQEFMLAERDAGMLLCLASKNNPEDVEETFRAHLEMPLQLDHFAGTRLNWEPKSANLRSLAEELNVGLESFVLVDNSATECAEVQASAPEVLTLVLPASSGEFAAFLDHVWAFDRWSTTFEDRSRAALYAQEAERARLARQTASLEEFLASLNLEIRIAAMSPEQLPRVSQLTRRTSQMNFTTVRRSETEIRSLLRDEGFECLTVDVSDRFGSYGLTGVMLFRVAGPTLRVDSFLLSCRALGRGVEHQMLAALGRIAKERSLSEVQAPFIPTPRNRPAEALLAGVGAQFRERTPEGSVFRFSSEFLAELRYTAAKESGAGKPGAVAAASSVDSRRVNYAQIASELRDPAQIRKAAGAKGRRVADLAPADLPRTELEKRLAGMWAGLLSIPAVGIHDNFFDLGGHSLLAVQLLSLVRQTFDVDLSLKVVYSGDFTVAELAKAIELREIADAGSDRYAAILRELEGLSEEEVRAALAEEQDGSGGRKP